MAAILLCLLAVICVYGGWTFLHRSTGYWNIAVFGVDSRDGNTKNALADVQVLCSINQKNGDIKLVSVYRDTYLKIDSKGSYHKTMRLILKEDTNRPYQPWKKIWILRLMIMQHLTGKQ